MFIFADPALYKKEKSSKRTHTKMADQGFFIQSGLCNFSRDAALFLL
jgi:hypothetical protein